MRRGGPAATGSRRPISKASAGLQDRAPTPTPLNASTFYDLAPASMAGGRDSDVSLCSSRPSSVGTRQTSCSSGALLTDKSAQAAALRSLNAFLAAHSASVSLRPPLPSSRDITEAFRFLLACLDWPLVGDLDDDLLLLLRHLHCPVKLNRSALKAPGTPHSWPHIISVLHWLVQLVLVAEQVAAEPFSGSDDSNDVLLFVTRSYSLFIGGDDEEAANLDEEYLAKAEHQTANTANAVAALEKEALELEAKLQALRSQPSRREALERKKGMLVEDVKKFHAIIDTWGGQVAGMEVGLQDREKELMAKQEESRRLAAENQELQNKVETQAVNVRDAERMKRELQAMEEDIAETESRRNTTEEKAWELEANLGRKLNEVEMLLDQCNQATKKLKLGSDSHYVLNAKGSSAAEVIGVNYKIILKPALIALSEDTKQISVSKLEESIKLQEKSRENAKILEEKKDRLAYFQAKIDEAEAHLTLLKNEIEDHASRCAVEVDRMKQDLSKKEHELNILEKEAEEFLKNSERELENATRESDEEVQMCANELVALIDTITEYKEYMESKINEVKADLFETAGAIASISAKLTSVSSSLSHCGIKRARDPPTSSS